MLSCITIRCPRAPPPTTERRHEHTHTNSADLRLRRHGPRRREDLRRRGVRHPREEQPRGKLEGLPAKASAVEQLPKEAPDLVIEFVPEDVRVKQAVYAEIEAAYSGNSPDNAPLIASGTSGLDLVELARKMKRPERFLGVHYFMPADTAPVVEVMAGLVTSRAEVDRVADALRRTGKEPVVLYKPIVGFLVNRLQHAILHEAYYLIEAGVASVEDIDHAARRMLAPRMCLNGLIQQKDISGLKIHADARSRSCRSCSTTRPPIPCSRRWSPSAEPGFRRAKVSTTGTAATSRRCADKLRASSPSCSNSCGAESARPRRGRGRRRYRSSGSGKRRLLDD